MFLHKVKIKTVFNPVAHRVQNRFPIFAKEFTDVKEEIKDYIRHHREQFKIMPFHKNNVKANPIEQFNTWFEDAVKSEIKDPFAFTLATANKNAIPTARVVYMREITSHGMVFFTNYKSHKGEDLIQNPVACANFYWDGLYRQVRFVGNVEKIPSSQSDAYFESRPRESQIGAWASQQSEVISNRDELLNKMATLNKQYENRPIQRPEFWGGFIIKPFEVEFWQGRESRLHDRIRYMLEENGNWKIERLSP